ncbi:hypothetical protein LINGRAHAP2_LOCUS11886 [Linum grandiflorum]
MILCVSFRIGKDGENEDVKNVKLVRDQVPCSLHIAWMMVLQTREGSESAANYGGKFCLKNLQCLKAKFMGYHDS